MASERIQRRIDRLLDQIEEAVDQLDWVTVRTVAHGVLVLDPGNEDATTFLDAAERGLDATSIELSGIIYLTLGLFFSIIVL